MAEKRLAGYEVEIRGMGEVDKLLILFDENSGKYLLDLPRVMQLPFQN